MYIFLLFLSFARADEIADYLQKYGYIDDISLVEDIQPALKLFQENYKLEPTGIADEATLELMAEPRCGSIDYPQSFMVEPSRKWKMNLITWYLNGYPQLNSLVQKAFDVWGKHTNLVFKRAIKDPTILISFADKKHYTYYSKQDCMIEFDGPGLSLAHAYHPDPQYNQTDIHIDNSETWDYTMNVPSDRSRSLFHVLVHEIGHALGIGHSYTNTSVMYPIHRYPRGLTDFNKFELTKDDTNAIQYLYGRPEEKNTTMVTSESPVTDTTSTTTTPQIPEESADYDICTVKEKIHTFVIVNGKIYAFYMQYVWVFDLDPSRRYKDQYLKTKILTDWLPFLPNTYGTVSAVYQRPDGNIALFYDKVLYIIKYPDLSLISKHSINTIIPRKLISTINTAFTTNQGKTYIITDNEYLYELNECHLKAKFVSSVPNTLQGVPNRVNGAFKYINGRIYFITDSVVLEYNEFTNAVSRSYSDAFEALQLACFRDSLLRNLYEVFAYLQYNDKA